MNKKMSLLELLAWRSDCQYLSDLRNPKGCAAHVLHELEKIDPEEAPLSEWNDALDYLAGAPAAENRTDAKNQLLTILSQRK